MGDSGLMAGKGSHSSDARSPAGSEDGSPHQSEANAVCFDSAGNCGQPTVLAGCETGSLSAGAGEQGAQPESGDAGSGDAGDLCTAHWSAAHMGRSTVSKTISGLDRQSGLAGK